MCAPNTTLVLRATLRGVTELHKISRARQAILLHLNTSDLGVRRYGPG